MRSTIIIFTIFFSFSIVSGQKAQVNLTNENIGGGKNNAFVTTIYQVEEADIRKAWKTWLKQYKPEKISGKDEIFADNATISSISENTIDIYAKAKRINDLETSLIVSFDLGGIFLDGNHVSSKSAEQIVYDFSVKTTTHGIEDEIKEEEKMLIKEEKALEKLIKDNDRLHLDIDKNKTAIETAKSNIEKAEKAIETNLAAQESSKKLVEKQKESVQSVVSKLKNINK